MTAALTATALAVPTNHGPPFKDVDFVLEKGEALGVTSIGLTDLRALLEALAGLRRASAGRVIWGGLPALGALYDDAASLRERYRALRGLRRLMGYVSDTVSLINNLTVYDNVALPLRYHFDPPERTVEERTERLLSMLCLEPVRALRPAALSLGAKRRAALARALILDPTVLFLDSPFSDIDNDSAEILVSVVDHYAKKVGLSVIAASYDPRQILTMASRVIVFHGGSIVATLSGEALEESRFLAEIARLQASYRS